MASPMSAAERTIKFVALGNLLTAGYQLAGAGMLFRCNSNAALKAKGLCGRGRQRRRVRRHQLRRPGPARLVGAGRHRRGDPRARRQRHAARRRSQGHAGGACRNCAPPQGAQYRGAVVRDAGRADFGAGLCAGVRRDLSRACRGERRSRSIHSFWTVSSPIASSTSATACIRPAKASPELSPAFCRRSRPCWPGFVQSPRRQLCDSESRQLGLGGRYGVRAPPQ